MLTYQIRPRVFRHDPGPSFSFPADCTVRLHLLPKQPFGVEPGGGRTAVQSKPARALFNANNGAHWIESNEPLSPLDVTIEEPKRLVRLLGNILEFSARFDSLSELEDDLMGLYFALPMLLNVDLADPPIVERVDGQIAGVPFRWELKEWRMQYDITTQDHQEQRFVTAWERLTLVAGLRNRRFLAAVHYFHVAVRLSRAAATPGEFMPEVILNLAKTLEVLFPPPGDGRTRDAARRGLNALGFSDAEIEADFLPAMALRNEIDVGHVDLSLFTRTQLKHIHAYTERAEGAFRTLLARALELTKAGTWVPPEYDARALSPAANEVLARLAQAPSDDAA